MLLVSMSVPRHVTLSLREARWPSGIGSDSGARGRGFAPHSGRRVVSLSKIHFQKVLVVAPSRHD